MHRLWASRQSSPSTVNGGLAPEIGKRTLLQSLTLGSRRILRSTIHWDWNRLPVDDVLDPIARCSNIGCVKGNFAALFDGVKALASYAVLGNDWIFHNMKCLFILSFS